MKFQIKHKPHCVAGNLNVKADGFHQFMLAQFVSRSGTKQRLTTSSLN